MLSRRFLSPGSALAGDHSIMMMRCKPTAPLPSAGQYQAWRTSSNSPEATRAPPPTAMPTPAAVAVISGGAGVRICAYRHKFSHGVYTAQSRKHRHGNTTGLNYTILAPTDARCACACMAPLRTPSSHCGVRQWISLRGLAATCDQAWIWFQHDYFVKM